MGLSLDESRPGVRTMPVGTVEQADQYAVDCFNTLGIDSDNPNGFTFSDALVGTVSYSHGGSDASVLATINVDVKQIPGLQQIRLVKQLPENAGGAPYYELGDVVRYKNRLYICVSNHTFGQEARFITLNDQSQHSKGKFTWIGHDQDSVYNDEMAKAEVLADWLKNVVCDYNVWKRVSDKLTDWGLDVRQVLPEDNLTRTTLINNIAHEMNYIPDIQKPNPIYEGMAMCIGIYPWFEQDSTRTTAIIAPVGFLLANKLRYTAIKDKWVPYIFMAREGDGYYQRLRAAQAQEPSQYSDKKHFMWQDLGTVTITAEDSLLGKRILSESEKNKLTADKYHICLIGMPGVGKTTTGKRLARMLGRPFVDMDDAFTIATKMPDMMLKSADEVPEIYAKQKEKLHVDYFDYYLVHDMNSVNFIGNNEVDARVEIVKAAENRFFVYSIHFNREKRTYQIIDSLNGQYDTKEKTGGSMVPLQVTGYAAGSPMECIVDYIYYPQP